MMSETKIDPKFIADGYDQICDAYIEKFRSSPSEKIRARVDRYIKSCNLKDMDIVLSLGCGSCDPIEKQLVEHGVGICGVDISSKMVELARKNIPGSAGHIVQGDFMGDWLNPGPCSTQGVIANCSILHVPRDRHVELYRRVFQWLTPGGQFLIGSIFGDYERLEEDWLGGRLVWSYHDPITTIRQLQSVGFYPVQMELEDDYGENGVWFLATKPPFRDNHTEQ